MNWILNRLRRVTLTTAYLPEVDGLRFIAIGAVIICHLAADLVFRHGLQVSAATQSLFSVMLKGERGVHLFFTISGFILALPFARRYIAGTGRPDYGRYFRRRLLRMEPPYIVNVLIITLATWVVTPNLRPVLIWHFLTALTYSHLLVFHYVNPINMIWWSLEIETQFYIVMPVLALVFKIRSSWLRRGILTGSALTTFVWQSAAHSWVVDMTLLGHIQFFLVGLLAADLYQSGVLSKLSNIASDALACLSVLLLFTLPAWWRTPAPALTFLIVLGALNGKLFKSFLSLRWISATGSMCYTIYLWHIFVTAAVLKLTLKILIPDSFILSMATQAAIIVPAIFFSSVFWFLLVEKPTMELDWPTALRKRLSKTPELAPAKPEYGLEILNSYKN